MSRNKPAREYLTLELGCQAAEIQYAALEVRDPHEGTASRFDKPVSFRHFTGTSMLAARRRVDDQDACWLSSICMPRLGIQYRLPRS